MQNTTTSLLALILDRSVGNILRMLRVIRLPKAERGPVSWGFVGTLAITLAYGLIMLFSASYVTAYYNFDDIYHYIAPQAILAVAGVGPPRGEFEAVAGAFSFRGIFAVPLADVVVAGGVAVILRERAVGDDAGAVVTFVFAFEVGSDDLHGKSSFGWDFYKISLSAAKVAN